MKTDESTLDIRAALRAHRNPRLLLLSLACICLPVSVQAGTDIISTVAGHGTAGVFLGSPTGVATDSSGNIYVVDSANCVVWEIPTTGTAFVFAGQGSWSCNGTYTSTNPTQVSLLNPTDVAVCGSNVFIADAGSVSSNGLHMVSGGVFSNLAITYQQALNLQPAPPVKMQLPPGTGQAFYVQPQAIACDANGHVFVQSFYSSLDSTQNWTLDAYSIPTGMSSNLAVSMETEMQGIAVDANKNVYTVTGPPNMPSQQGILKIPYSAGSGAPVAGIASRLSLTRPIISSTRYVQTSCGITSLNYECVYELGLNTTRLSLDTQGNFYVNEALATDPSATPVSVYLTEISPTSSGSYTLTYIAGTGVAGYNGDDIPATQAELNGAEGSNVGPNGAIYIGDSANGRVRQIRGLQAGPQNLTLSPPLPLSTYVGAQQYTFDTVTGDLYYASADGVRVFGNFLNPMYDTVEAIIPVGATVPGFSPITLIADPTRNLVYANNSADGNLYVINGATRQVVESVAINNPGASLLAIDTGLNQIYIAGPNSTAVSVVQGAALLQSAKLLANIGYPAVFLSSVGVDPNTHNFYGLCNACVGAGTEEGVVTINGSTLAAFSEAVEPNETIVAPDFIANSLAVDSKTGSLVIAGAASLNHSFTQTYDVLEVAPGLASNLSLALPFPPITAVIDPVNRVFYVTDYDGVPTDPSSNAAIVGGMDSIQLSSATFPISFPTAAATAHVYDLEPDTGTFQAYLSAASAGGTAQGIVELWNGLTQQVTQTVTIPNAGGGYLAVNSTNSFVYLMDNVNLDLYIINGPTLTPVPSPTFNPSAGPELPNTLITVSVPGAADPDDTIYYTLDGSPPTGASTSCMNPCTVTVNASVANSTRLNAIALRPNGIYSSDAAATYTNQAPTTMAVTLGQSSVAGGVPVTATATVTPSPGGSANLQGTVTFTAAMSGSPTITLCSAVSILNNQAICGFNLSTAGAWTITATYSGDAFDAPSSGGAPLTVASSGNSSTPVTVTDSATPVALTANNTGSLSTYVLNSDTSISVIQNGAVVAGAGCPALPSFAGDTVNHGAIYFDPSTNIAWLAFTADSSTGTGIGIVVTYETIGSNGSCTPGSALYPSTFSFGNIEMAVDSVQGNVYVLNATEGASSDALYILSIASFGSTQISQVSLDYSATYGPLVLDSSTHRLFINDFGISVNAPAGLNNSPGFFVYDPNNSGTPSQNIQHVTGYINSLGTGVPIYAETLLAQNGELIIVSQNPQTGPPANLSVPITILNTAAFSFFSNTTKEGPSGVYITPGLGLSFISAVTPYSAMSAATLDSTGQTLYGFAYTVSTSTRLPIQGTGALLSYQLSNGAEALFGSGLTIPTVRSSLQPWSQLLYDPTSQNLVLSAANVLGVSGPLCAGSTVSVEQSLGGGANPPNLSVPALNFATGYVYDIDVLSSNATLYAIAPLSNPCGPVILPANTILPPGTAGVLYNPAGVFTSTGGAGQISWSVPSGMPPPNVSVNPTTGALSGTPGYTGTYTFTVQAEDSLSNKASQTYSLQINCASNPSLTLPDLVQETGVFFSYQLSGSGGTAPLLYSDTGLGNGISVSNTGLLSGTPQTVGTVTLNVTVTDTYGCTGSATGKLVVVPIQPTITRVSPNNAYLELPSAGGFPGETENVTVTGTNFLDPTGHNALPVFNFGPYVTVTNVAVSSSTTATMTLAVSLSAPLGWVSASVTTGSSFFQGGTATLMEGLDIVAYLPTITSITQVNSVPLTAGPSGFPGQTETITVNGTNLADPTGNGALPVFNFGPGITANTVSVSGGVGAPQSATVSLAISPSASTGLVNVTVTTGSPSTFLGGTGALAGAFDVVFYAPAITSISPINTLLGSSLAAGFPGQSGEILTVAGTNLVDPTGNHALPIFNFGPGTTATTVSVSGALGSPQTATVMLAISPAAALGPVDVSVTTGSPSTFQGTTATLPKGFGIIAYVPAITSISPIDSLLGLPTAGGFPGQTGDIATITGTNFIDPTGNGALPTFNFGPGTTATTVSVSGSLGFPQTATVMLAIGLSAPIGPVTVSVTTGSPATFQGGTASIGKLFNIQAVQPSISGVAVNNPSAGEPADSGYPGQMLTLTISGSNFQDPTGNGAVPVVTFGSTAIAVTGISVTNNNTIVAMISISQTATPQSVSLTVATGSAAFLGGTTTLQSALAIVTPVSAHFVTVTSVTSNVAGGSYSAGAVIPVLVNFTAPVDVTGTPSIALNSGGAAPYTSGSGTSTLTFTYTVTSGQGNSRLDVASTDALSLNGGTITDMNSNPAVLTLPAPGGPGSLAANTNITINTSTGPAISISQPSPSGVYLKSGALVLNYTVTDSGGPGLGSVTATMDGNATVDGQGLSSGQTIQLADLSEGSHTFTVTAVDKTGNQSSASVTFQVESVFITGLTSATPAQVNNFTGLAGMELTVGSNNLVVSQVGRMCSPGNSGMHTVEFLDISAGGIAVPGGSAMISMASCTVGQFVYSALSAPITLTAGRTYYLASLEQSGGDGIYQNAPVITATDAVVSHAAYLGGNSWALAGGANNSDGPVNFAFTTATPSQVPLVLNYDLNGGSLRNNLNTSVGMKFTVGASPITVYSLARVCVAGNSQNHTVEILNAISGTVVSGASVSVSMSGCQAGQWVSSALSSPVTLPAGASYYLASSESTNGDFWYNNSTLVSSNGVNVNGAYYFNGTSWISVSGANTSFGVPNLIYSTAPPPGCSWTCFVTGAALNNPATRNNFSGFAGTRITVGSNALSVWSVGRDCVAGNSQAHVVKFVNVSAGGFDQPGASAIVNMSNCTPGQFVYATLSSPIVLPAGSSYYLVSQEQNGGDLFYDVGQISTTTEAAVVGAAYYNGTSWVVSGGPGTSYVPPSFVYTLATSDNAPSFVIDFNLTGAAAQNTFNGFLGMKLTTGPTPVPASMLGRACIAGNSQSHTVEIVNATTETVIGSATVNMAGCTPGEFVFAAISQGPITLSPNTAYFLVSQEATGGDQWYISGALITTPVATVNSPVYSTNGTSWVTGVAGSLSYVPPNFQ